MKIRGEQVEQLSARAVENFVGETMRHLRRSFPDWSSSRDEDSARAFVRETIELARINAIYHERNVLRLAELRVLYEPEIRAPSILMDMLPVLGQIEDQRVDALANALRLGSHRLRTITLDDDLPFPMTL